MLNSYIGSKPNEFLAGVTDGSFVEVDVDGVLANMMGGLTPFMQQYIPDFDVDKYVRDWNFTDIEKASREAYAVAWELLSDPAFIRGLDAFPNAYRGMDTLLGFLGHPDMQKKGSPLVVIHTHIPPRDSFASDPLLAAKMRADWCQRFLGPNANGRVAVIVDTGRDKERLTSRPCLALFEDNTLAMNGSVAEHRYLIRNPHTQHLDLGWNDELGCTVVDSFYDGVHTFIIDGLKA